MSIHRPPAAPPSPQQDRRRTRPGWRWPLRVVATLLTLLLWTQPLLIGLFLGGEFEMLAVHAAVGGGLVAITLLQFFTVIPAWRPGGLPGWVVAAGAAMVVGAGVQIAAGYQRDLGVHVPLGVALAAAGLSIAVRSWWPTPDPDARQLAAPLPNPVTPDRSR